MQHNGDDSLKSYENLLFTDEKFFTIEEPYNNQNNKIYAQTSLEVHSEDAGHHPSYVMVWWGGVPSGGHISSFLQEWGETGVRVYQEDVLQGVVKQLHMTLFSGQEWVSQQDSVPAQEHVPAFNGAEDWPSGSPEL
jgi:hypothetical protein